MEYLLMLLKPIKEPFLEPVRAEGGNNRPAEAPFLALN